MKNLAQHIECLLTKHDCVIVPEFGGFIVFYENAYVKDNKIYAPSCQIRFNQKLTHNDGLLVESYMKDLAIGYDQALSIVNDEIRKINDHINTGSAYVLGRVGCIVKSVDGNITLRNSNTTFLPYNFGFSNIDLKTLSSSQSLLDKNRVSRPISEVRDAFHYVAMIVVLFLITLLFPTHINDSSNYASFSIEKFANVFANEMHNDKFDVNEGNEIILNNDLMSASCPDSISDSYHLIIASFSNLNQANAFISQQVDYNKDQLRIISSKGKFRVSAFSFKKYDQAIGYLKKIKANSSKNRAWILCR